MAPRAAGRGPVDPAAHRPNEANGLETLSRPMVDEITTVPKAKLGQRVGRMSDRDMIRLDRAMLIFLGLAA